ncbi:hypothetical protein [Pseudescherichia sp.]|uniref:hypothetical protein n=1 Tax=Pseudescherichia sp. TaxID=2055881 RepID=UPI00289CA2FF|nr:hypothetical protein [Pseudescherichia sp.]
MNTFTKDPSTHPANGPLTEERLIRVREVLALRDAGQEPVAWVRYCSDGTIDGPLLNYQIDDCRKSTWTPLYAAPPAPVVTAEPVRYMNRHTGACYTQEQQPDAATDTAVYVPLFTAQQALVVDRQAIINKVQGLCSRLPGATFSNAAEFAIDEMLQSFGNSEQLNSPAASDGWVAVPAKHTSAMYYAGGELISKHNFNPGDIWQAMLDAAPKHDGWAMMPAAYLDLISAPKQEEAKDKTTQQFESLGFFVTSDERKMEIPRCSKHPEITLQTNPFELLMSYPPRPVMYCPECEPWVAERVEVDKQLRHKGVR